MANIIRLADHLPDLGGCETWENKWNALLSNIGKITPEQYNKKCEELCHQRLDQPVMQTLREHLYEEI